MAQPQRFRRQSTQAYLEALEQKDASLELLLQVPKYEDERIQQLKAQLEEKNLLKFRCVWGEVTGFYFFKLFLISQYEAPKALFVKDVEAYRSMRFESARIRVARKLYERFVAEDAPTSKITIPEDLKHNSTFDIISREDKNKGVASPVVDEKEDPMVELSKAPGGGVYSGDSNPIGVYGAVIENVRKVIASNKAPADLFDELYEEVFRDISLDVFPRFKQSEFFQKYVRTKYMETRSVTMKDFTNFRILGRGGFGAVYASRKNNSGALYAVKLIAKKLVKAKNALPNIMDELSVLKLLNSPFVSHLKYAFQDDDYLYLVIDLLLGGDLKFHLIEEGRFSEERARLYGAQMVLALEHLHSLGIIYRDLKLENVILDKDGHAKLVDLGLAVVARGKKIKGYAGTPGYCAPEMVANHSYGTSVDVFSLGVLIYRMLRGRKPFVGKTADELDYAVLRKSASFPSSELSPEAISLLKGLLRKKPENRLGCQAGGLDDIKKHEFFASIDWGLLEAGYVDPPFVPNKEDVNSASSAEIGDFDLGKMGHIMLDNRFKAALRHFDYVSPKAVQDELVMVLEKAYQNVPLERFSSSDNITTPGKKGKTKRDKPCVIS